MFDNPSLVTRIGIGKVIGLMFGFIGFIAVPFYLKQACCCDGVFCFGTPLWEQ